MQNLAKGARRRGIQDAITVIKMNIIGINAFHADSAVCLVINGQLITAVEKERFNHIKPTRGIRLFFEN